MKLSKYFDHTILKADVTETEIIKLCEEALEYDFASVCVNPSFVAKVKSLLQGSDVKVCTVVGFPLGQNTTKVKVLETIDAIENGADEIDMVINVSWIKDQKYQLVEEEIYKVKQACGDKILKVILETNLLSDQEIVKATELSVKAQADYVKTSTGFNNSRATIEAVKLMKTAANSQIKVKASGGIRTSEDFVVYRDLAVERIGTSSAIKIIQGLEHE